MASLWALPGNLSRGNGNKHKKLNEKGYNPQVVGDGPRILLLAKVDRCSCRS